jgi:hypothetical protein
VGAVGQLFLLLIFSFCGALHAQEFYRWVDDKGIIHFTDSLHSVPEKYRCQAEKRWLAPSTQLPKPVPQSESKRSDEPAPQKSCIPFIRQGKEILVEGIINQRGPVKLIVDRGALITTVPASIASQLGINLETTLPIRVQGILGGTSGRFLTIDNSLRVGDVEVDDLEIEIRKRGPSGFGLLGIDFFGRFRVHIDHGSSQMELIREEGPYDGLSPEWWQEKFRFYRSLKRTYEQ